MPGIRKIEEMKVNGLVKSLLKRSIIFTSDFIGVLFVLSLYVIKPYKHIKFFTVGNDDRIGHLVSDLYLILKRIELKKIDCDSVAYVGIICNKIANEQIVKMFKRKLRIYKIPISRPPSTILGWIFWNIFSKKTFFSKSIFFQDIQNVWSFYEYNHGARILTFSETEEKQGRKLLKKMGIGETDWFICFHSRDAVYLEKEGKKSIDWSHHDFRDCEIDNYLGAADYITSSGGHAIRMGYHVKKELPANLNNKIIDYSTKYRNDFGDIFLPAKCKFFLGNTTGLLLVPTIFQIPIALANSIPYDNTPLRAGDIYIPKKIWSIKENRFLTFKEIFDSEIANYCESIQFEKAGLRIVENSSEEILDLAIEMNERLDGTWISTKEDEELQMKFKSLFRPHHKFFNSPARIGAAFLRKNIELLAV